MKGLCVRGELETEQTATYWPQVPLMIAALLSHSAGLLNWGPESPSPLLWAGSHCLELQFELQLTDSNSLKLSVVPGYIIVWHPPASCGRRICTEFNPSTGQGYILMSSTGCICFSIDGWVEGQYVTPSRALFCAPFVPVSYTRSGSPSEPSHS